MQHPEALLFAHGSRPCSLFSHLHTDRSATCLTSQTAVFIARTARFFPALAASSPGKTIRLLHTSSAVRHTPSSLLASMMAIPVSEILVGRGPWRIHDIPPRLPCEDIVSAPVDIRNNIRISRKVRVVACGGERRVEVLRFCLP